MQRRDWLQAAGLTLTSLTASAQAQTWPDRPVKWTLSQPPGSGPDNVARILGDRLGKSWGQAVVIETSGCQGST